MPNLKLLSFAALATALLPSAALAQTDISAQLQPLIARTDVPAVTALTIRNGVVTAEGSAGVRDTRSGAPVANGDAWHIGSDSKAITATMIARLVEQGVLSWDATLAEMMPTLVEGMNPAFASVRLEDLLPHRAGLVDIIGLDETLAYFNDSRPLPEQRLEYVTRALAMDPVAPAGTTSNYSNSGYVLAAVIAETKTGRPVEDLIRELVLQPLGMASADFGATVEGEPLGHEGGQPLTGVMADNPAVLAPAGELHMSLGDWAKFVIDQMRGEKGEGQLLSAENYARLHRPQGETNTALGWGVIPVFRGIEGPLLSHVGSNGYWRAMVVARPANDSALLTVVNCGDGCDAAAVNRATLDALAVETLKD
ncbi:serine hydrolase domain-containing protein [uncultured Brevundimonas sp.]|uniref:serine hydrolase domain-containing protein n=1 Tax=uncultured Brevundimonas sp. TaxID=213418 RepID=UPI00260C5ECA|nr:serine hydrolase domain-containing protein [uncultured Brevundimonas sp.]